MIEKLLFTGQSPRMGHWLHQVESNATLNVYAHLMEKENQEAVCRLENTIIRQPVTKWSQKQKRG